MRAVKDRLYGKIRIEKPVQDILRCEKIQRLGKVSLSAVPDRFLVPRYFKDMASRLEHSIGMSHLVSVLCGFRPEFEEYRNLLLLAAVCHDAGAPPFSHNGEYLLGELTGMNHERYTEHILKGSVAADVIKKYGYPLRQITEIINGGSGFLGKLMNNTVDLDNADNTERYGFGSGIVGRISDPEELAKAFLLKNGGLFLDRKYSAELEKWKLCRKKVYGKIVYGDANISAGGMLRRALGFVYEENGKALKKEGFLEFNDNEALKYMEENSPEARALIESAESGIFYRKVAEISSFNPSAKMEELCGNWSGRIGIADGICEKFGLRRQDVCAQAFRQKPERSAENFYPQKKKSEKKKWGTARKSSGIFGAAGNSVSVRVGGEAPRFDMRVFVNPRLRISAKNVLKFLLEITDMQ